MAWYDALNFTPIANAVEEAKRKNWIKIALVAVVAAVLFLVFRKK